MYELHLDFPSVRESEVIFLASSVNKCLANYLFGDRCVFAERVSIKQDVNIFIDVIELPYNLLFKFENVVGLDYFKVLLYVKGLITRVMKKKTKQ